MSSPSRLLCPLAIVALLACAGLALAEPYAMKDLQMTAVSQLQAKNVELEGKVSKLMEQNEKLLETLQKLLPKEEKKGKG